MALGRLVKVSFTKLCVKISNVRRHSEFRNDSNIKRQTSRTLDFIIFLETVTGNTSGMLTRTQKL